MRKHLALLRVNFRAMLTSFSASGSSKGKKKRAATGIAALLLMAFLGLYISTVYSSIFAELLSPSGMIWLVPVLMSFVTCLMSLMFTSFAASGIVFGNKDSDLMLSLPISSFAVMLSKLLALYMENLVFGIFMMLPAGAIYLLKGGEGGIGFALRYLIANLALPILPTIFALLLGFVLALFQAKLGRNAFIGNLMYLLSFVLVMYFMFKLQMILPDLLTKSNQINNIFSTWLYPLGLFRDGIYGSYLALIGFIAILLLPYLAIVYLMSMRYKKILTVLASTKTKNDYRLASMKSQGQIPALLKKEFGRYFGTPIYVFNTGIGVVMALVGAVAAVLNKNVISTVLLQAGMDIPLFPLTMLIATFMCVLTATSCVSISLEGKTLWILKEAPINIKFLLLAKALVNMSLIWIIALIGTPALWYALDLTLIEAFGLFSLCVALGPFVAFSGLVINLFFPKMDSPNDILIVKQSTSVLLGIFSGFGVIGLGAGAMLLFKSVQPALMAYAFSAVLLLISAALWAFLSAKGEKMLKQI